MDSHERVRVDSHERAWADGPEQALAPPRGDVSERRITATGWLDGARIIICFVAILWLIEAINTGLGHAFNVFGIFPREVATLPGILFWPFLHGNFQHLIMNTTPLLVLGLFVAMRGPAVFLQTSVIVMIVGGLGVWVFGREAYHIGASGLVFGYFGFLVAVGIYERRVSSLAVASLAVFYYGGLIFGVLPSDSFVSWEGHLFGLAAGVLAARFLARRPALEAPND